MLYVLYVSGVKQPSSSEITPSSNPKSSSSPVKSKTPDYNGKRSVTLPTLREITIFVYEELKFF